MQWVKAERGKRLDHVSRAQTAPWRPGHACASGPPCLRDMGILRNIDEGQPMVARTGLSRFRLLDQRVRSPIHEGTRDARPAWRGPSVGRAANLCLAEEPVATNASFSGTPHQRKFLRFSFTRGMTPKRRIKPPGCRPVQGTRADVDDADAGREPCANSRGTLALSHRMARLLWLCETPSALRRLDQWIRRRLRSIAWKTMEAGTNPLRAAVAWSPIWRLKPPEAPTVPGG
jgi:hypothetical protein